MKQGRSCEAIVTEVLGVVGRQSFHFRRPIMQLLFKWGGGSSKLLLQPIPTSSLPYQIA